MPLPADEVDGILRQMEEGAEKPKLKSTFQKGDKVRAVVLSRVGNAGRTKVETLSTGADFLAVETALLKADA